MNVKPLQEHLVKDYPQLFSGKDLAWLKHSEVITTVKGNNAFSKADLRAQYTKLSEIIDTTTANNPLYQQALQDRLSLANRLGDNELVFQDYDRLNAMGVTIPTYTKEAYADTLLRAGSPSKALSIYEEIAEGERHAKRPLSTALLLKLVNASSDAADFSKAQAYQDQIKEKEVVWDFPRTTQLSNPNYDRAYYSQVNLQNWRGNRSTAVEMLENRLTNQTQGDPWVILALADIESSHNNHDKATTLVNKSQNFLERDDQVFAKNQLAHIALNRGDLSQAHQLLSSYSEKELLGAESVLKRYEEAKQGSFTAAFGVQHQTAPRNKSGNEQTQ